MRALVWHGPRSLTLEQVPEPRPAAGEVLLRPIAVGICGSELSGYLGENSLRQPPLVMGHEFCAAVESGPPKSRFVSGQRVVVNPLLSCGACTHCRRGEENLCAERRIVGAACPGAFADLVVVPESACHAVPESLPDELAAMVEPLACAVRTVELGRIGVADSVLIVGAGAIGLFALAVARHAGAGVIAVLDPNRQRLQTAHAWGATHLLDAREDVAAQMRRLTGGLGADVAIEAVGIAATRRTAVYGTRRGGRVVFIGLHEPESALPINEIVRNETEIAGSFCYRSRTFERALALLRAGLLPRGAWQEVRPLEAGPASFEELLAGAAASTIVLRV